MVCCNKKKQQIRIPTWHKSFKHYKHSRSYSTVSHSDIMTSDHNIIYITGTNHLNGMMFTSPFLIFRLFLNLQMFLVYQCFLQKNKATNFPTTAILLQTTKVWSKIPQTAHTKSIVTIMSYRLQKIT